MKKTVLFSLCVVFTFFVNKTSSQTWVEQMQDPNVNFYDVQKAFNDYYKNYEPKFRETEKLKKASAIATSTITPFIPVKGAATTSSIAAASVPEKVKMAGGWKAYKRWENYMEQRLYPSGDRSVMVNAWNEYLDNFYAGSASGMRASGPGAPATMAANWSLVGPTTTIPTGGGGAGRVNFVRFDPAASTTIYVGSPGGGLWKSTNSGSTWSTGTDNLAVIGCTDLAIHPTNSLIQYLATGDGEAQDTYSIGVLKTTNGGTSWSPSGLTWLVTQGRTISRLLINPQNPNTLFAATSNGVYRTRNAGAAWTQIATAIANVKDIEFKPGDTTTVYACSTTLFYRSTNAGTTFATTSTGLPAAASVSRLAIGVSAANATYVYVLAANAAFGYQGIYRSANSGATFTARSTSPNLLGYNSTGSDAGGQGWYDLSIAVSPLNAEQVIVGGVNIWRSINGGTSWTINAHWTGTGAPYVHADIHALEFLPGSGTTYFSGNDGGLFRTTTSGTSWSDLSNGLQISQIYRIGLSATNQNLLLSGWQDNGTNRWSGTATWSRPLGGDGMECIVDWSNANVQYGELYYGDINKTTTGGNLTTNIVASGGTGVNADGDWVTPFIEAPSNAATLFVGKAQVYKSTNSGGTWAQVGTISGGTGSVIALANAASNINYIYAAKRDKFYACTTGAAFTDRTAGLPTASAAISYIAVDPLNANRVWVTFSGYSAANKVWYSANAGVTWSNYSTGLPNLPANCIVYQGSSTNDPLYVGTDVGVYYRDNTAGSWVAYNTGLPNVSVRELEIQYTALKLRAATFGRAVWQSDLASPGTSPPVADFSANRTTICVGDCINFTDLSSGSATSWAWTFTGASTTSSTLQNPTGICYNTPGTYQVSMIATNTNGNNTMTKTAYITVSSPIALPLVEGFQGAAFVPSGWYLSNPDLDMTWAQSTTVGGFSTSTNSAAMDNLTPATSIAGSVDELWTPKYNFTGVSSATMTFDVAYCRYNATYFDSLIVFVSTNCGSTWSRVYSKGGTGLATAADNATTVFVPTAAQWRTETVSMTPYAGQANVMVKFQNKSGWGQILYLDNINITGIGAPVAGVTIASNDADNVICAGTSVTFTATPTNGGTTPTYQWQVNGVNVGGATASTFTTSTITTGQIVTCNMTSSLAGVVGSPAPSGPITMTVNPLPATPTPGSNSPVCVGSTINLTSFTVAGATYSWTGPGAFSSSLEDPTRPGASLSMAGTYSLTVTVGGCASLVGTTVLVVNALPTTPTAGSNSPVCVGSIINLTSNTVAGATYSWIGPGAFSSALEDPSRPSASTAMAGTYSLTVTVAGCSSAVATTVVAVNTAPATPTVGSSTPDCVGQTISLTSNTIAGATYSWTGPAAFNSALEDPTRPSATLAMAGTYSLTVTVAGCTSAMATTTVVVNALPATPVPSINASTTPAAICAGGTITLTTPNLGAGFTYSWTGPNSYAAAVRNPPALTSVTTVMGGTYSLTVTNGGCSSLAGTVTIVVNPTPAAPTAGSNSPVCTGSSILLTSNTVAGATYAWTGPSTFTSALEDPSRPTSTLAMAGTYSVTVTVAGCTSPAGTVVVAVSGSVVPTNAITASPSGAICAGTSVTLTASAGGGGTTPTYQWQVNGSNVGTGGTTYTSSALTSGQIVTCILTSSSSCAVPTTATSNTITMLVNPVVVPSVSVAASPSGAICNGTSVVFTATPTNGGTTPTYQWQVNGSNVGTGGTAYSSSALASGDVVTCTMTSNATCPSTATATSSGITITVNPTVTPAVSVVASPAGAICSGTSVLFTATPTNGGTTPTYQWQLNGSNVGTGGTTYTSASLVNADIVTCTVTSNATCASSLTGTSTGITMVVNPTPATPTISVLGSILTSSSPTGNQWYLNGISIAGATNQNYTFTANGTYTVIVTVVPCSSAESAPEVITTTGIEDASNQYGLNIYPNPNDGNFNILFNANVVADYTLELTNALGQLIYKEELKNYAGAYRKPFSVVEYGKGLYTITLTNDKNEVVKKIIVY